MMMEVVARQPTELSNDLNVLTAEINAYQRVAGEAIFEIGKRLKHVRDNKIAEQKGGWNNWCENELGMTKRYANMFIQVVEKLRGSENTYSHLGVNALKIIATMQPDQRDIEHEIVEVVDDGKGNKKAVPTGKFKLCKDMTVKELRNVKKVLEGKIEVIESEKEKLVASNNKLTSENSKLESANKKLNSQVDRLVDENDDLHDELSKKPKEVIVEKEVEKIVEVEKVVYKENEEMKVLYNNYKTLSDELQATQEKLLQYENSPQEIKSVESMVEEILPRTILTLKDLSKQLNTLLKLNNGWNNVDNELFNEFSEIFNNTSELMELLLDAVNKEI